MDAFRRDAIFSKKFFFHKTQTEYYIRVKMCHNAYSLCLHILILITEPQSEWCFHFLLSLILFIHLDIFFDLPGISFSLLICIVTHFYPDIVLCLCFCEKISCWRWRLAEMHPRKWTVNIIIKMRVLVKILFLYLKKKKKKEQKKMRFNKKNMKF